MIDENAVISEIIAILSDIEIDDTPVLKQLYDHIPAQYMQFPACYVVPGAWQESLADLRDTEVTQSYRIGIVYTLDPDMREGQVVIRDTAALVRNELKKQENIQLGGTVDWSEQTGGSYSFNVTEQKVAVCEITIQVRKRYSRYSN